MSLAIGVGLFVPTACSITPAPDAGGDPVLETGRDIWVRQCASCHGTAGGGGRGPALSEGRVVERFTVEENRTLVVDGVRGMPGFGGRLTENEIDAVVRYSREVL